MKAMITSTQMCLGKLKVFWRAFLGDTFLTMHHYLIYLGCPNKFIRLLSHIVNKHAHPNSLHQKVWWKRMVWKTLPLHAVHPSKPDMWGLDAQKISNSWNQNFLFQNITFRSFYVNFRDCTHPQVSLKKKASWPVCLKFPQRLASQLLKDAHLQLMIFEPLK